MKHEELDKQIKFESYYFSGRYGGKCIKSSIMLSSIFHCFRDTLE